MTTERKLTARSVILSLLLGNQPPRLPTAVLIRVTELFGIAGGTARTALSRMAAAGELTAGDGSYEITAARLLDRQRQQVEGREAHTRPWDDGAWLQAVVVSVRRAAAERAELRAALQAVRMAERREGVWMRPDNLGTDRPAGPLEWFRAVPEGDHHALAASLWDLDGWADKARELEARLQQLTPSLELGEPEALAPGFVLSAEVLRHLRADPLLPDDLLPSRWPGPELRSGYERYDAAYRSLLRDWFRS